MDAEVDTRPMTSEATITVMMSRGQFMAKRKTISMAMPHTTTTRVTKP